jgi:hypothetical protein
MGMGQPEYCDYGIKLEWSADGEIGIISTEGDMSREAVDTWADLTIRTITQFPTGKTGYLVLNMTGPKQGYTPYAARRTVDVYRAVPAHTRGYAAIVMRDSLLIRMMRALIRKEMHLMRGGVTQRFFTSLDEAMQWIQQCQSAQQHPAASRFKGL